MAKAILSKSTFIRGQQCAKALYLCKHHYNLKDAISPQLQAIFNQGNWPKIYFREVWMRNH